MAKCLTRLWAVLLVSTCISFPGLAQKKQSYAEPVYPEDDRLQRMKAAMPFIDSLYRDYAKEKQFPSLAYGLVADGQLIASGCLGQANTNQRIRADLSTLYRIASMSKSITALAILQLRDAGRLRLDDPVDLYIPLMKNNSLLTTDAPPITIRHLMSHAAGFPEDNPWGDRQLEDTHEDLVALIRKGTWFSNVPGVAYEYSNLGFALLGQIVEKVSGQPLEQYTREKIFKPLGMDHTEWEYTKVPQGKLALGYRRIGQEWIEEPLLHHGVYGAMGGLITSIGDFQKYLSLHLSAWPPRDGLENPVLKRSSLREMHLPVNFSGFHPAFRYPGQRPCAVVTAYGYGLSWMRDCEGRVYVGHSGGLPGYGSQWRFLPEYGIGLVAFANLTYADLGTINLRVLDSLIRRTGIRPRGVPASPVLLARQKQLIQVLPDWKAENLSALSSGAGNIFAENFFEDVSLETRQMIHQRAFKAIGPILRNGPLIAENQLRGSYLVEGEKGKLSVFFTLSPEDPPLIQELEITIVK